MCRENFAACFKNHAEYINELCGQDAEIFNVELSGEKRDQLDFKG